MASAEGASSAQPQRAGLLRIELVYCPQPGRCDRVLVALPAGSTLAQALQASGLVERHGLQIGALKLGVWARPREPASLLRDLDRVEIYRALTVDPKEARRQRFRRQKVG